MSILEALISITVAAGVFAGAAEAWRSAISRSALARADTELTLVARAVLLQATAVVALESSVREGVTASGVRWQVTTTVPRERAASARLAEIEVAVELGPEGAPTKWRLTTLKLLPGFAP